MRALCVSIHDVAPRTYDSCRKIADAVRGIDPALPLTLLVVPCYHGDSETPVDYAGWIAQRLARGDELALHGYTHRDESPPPRSLTGRVRRRMYTAAEGEFSALTREEARERIDRGRRWFAERGWPVRGFVAPAWLVSAGTWDALRDCGFLYTTTLGRFHVLENGRSLRAPSLVYSTRSAWRRRASLAWNALLASASREMPLVRVSFHPADAAHPEVMAQALSLLAKLMRDREPLTKAEFARTVKWGA